MNLISKFIRKQWNFESYWWKFGNVSWQMCMCQVDEYICSKVVNIFIFGRYFCSNPTEVCNIFIELYALL